MDEEDSLSESSDDDSAGFLTAELNEQIQKTLLDIRSNNPIIYEKDATFFTAPGRTFFDFCLNHVFFLTKS